MEVDDVVNRNIVSETQNKEKKRMLLNNKN